jgi:uncharacterized protein YabE (DUF348 family)
MILTTPRDGDTSRREPAVTGSVSLARPAPGRPVGDGLSKGIWWVAGLALLALIAVAAIVFYAFGSIRVEVSIDGETQLLDTRAGSVAELLAEMDVTVTDADAVEPPPDVELAEGDTVTVRYARPLIIVIDGSETEHLTTMLTVGDALEEVGAPVAGAAISVPLSDTLPRTGMSIEITTPKPLSLDVGGEIRDLTSTASTVGDVLNDEGVELAGTDTVAPPINTPVTGGIVITVTRVRIENEVRTETIAHETVEQDDPELVVGAREVVTEGVDGAQDVTYAVTYTNGEITSEEVISSTVTQEPVAEIVVVGTKQLPSSDLNWAALAECESSGNPTAVNPAGYYGLYQFSLSTWASVGGSGNPVDASPEEQTLRAQMLYERSGAGQWPHCGPQLFT